MNFNQGGSQYENPAPGSYLARCIGLIDLGTHEHTYPGKPPRKTRDVRIQFELPTELMTGEFQPELKGKPFGVGRTLTQSLHPKAGLRKLLEGWRGKKFTQDDINAFQPKSLLGKACRITLIQNGDYVDLDSIAPLTKHDAKMMPRQVNKSVYFSLEEGEYDQKAFDALGQRTKEKVMSSPEYQALHGGGEGGGQDFGPGETGQADSFADSEAGGQPSSDDVPF